MARIDPEIRSTQDGSPTLIHPLLGELYHSLHGAVQEAEHVYIRNGFQTVKKPRISVFEMGFGSGLNALLTLRESLLLNCSVAYTTVEQYPISEATATALSYTTDLTLQGYFQKLHQAPWGIPVAITPRFTLLKIESSLWDFLIPSTPEDRSKIAESACVKFSGQKFEVVYFDAFAPDVQPDLWQEEIFRNLGRRMTRNGILVTYSAKGSVKENLRHAGFTVTRLPGAPGKRHMVRAYNTAAQSETPLQNFP